MPIGDSKKRKRCVTEGSPKTRNQKRVARMMSQEQLQQMLIQTLNNTVTMQGSMQDQVQQMTNGMANMRVEKKVSLCPQRRKETSLSAWASEVKMWNRCHRGREIAPQKYLNLLESVRKSDDDELKKFVETNIVENEEVRKDDENSIETIIDEIEKCLGKSNLEKSTEAWMNFINISQKPDENMKEYVTRFEQAECNLRNSQQKIPNKSLGIHLLTKSNLSEASKQNVLTKVNTENHDTMYAQIAKAMRELKTMTTNSKEETEKKETPTYYADRYNGRDMRRRSRSRYGDQYRRDSYRRDGDQYRRDSYRRDDSRHRRNDSRHRRGRSYQRDVERYSDEEGKERYRRDSSRNRYRDSSRNSRRDGSRNRRRNSSRGDRSFNEGSRGASRNNWRSKTDSNTRTSGEVNYTDYTSYDDNLELITTVIDSEDFSNDFAIENEKFNNDFVEIVFNEGNTDIDPFKCVVDCGAPKTVAGKRWMDSYIATKDDNFIVKLKKENERFKFGPSKIYTSENSHEIEVEIGKLKTTIKVSVVNADIPLLLGLDYQRLWGIVMDIANRTLYIKATKETFSIKGTRTNHWTLPIQKHNILQQAHKLVLYADILDMENSNLWKHIKKVHKNLAHKSEKQLLLLFNMAGKSDIRLRKIIREVVEKCDVCNKFKKTPPRPKVAMAKATSPNEVVSLDLKEQRKEGKHILYCVDEFSGYIIAEVIPNKKPDTILEAFNRRWIKEGPGIPSHGIFSDNGGEFKNPQMKEFAAKYGFRISLTAGNSPWSNGKNERNHYTCDRTIKKLMEDDPKMTLVEAVRQAVYVHNLQINKSGFSPRQLTFGRQGVIPGITDGTPISMEPIVESDKFRLDFINRQKAEEIYRKIDSNERIQKALSQQTYGYIDETYNMGDVVLFKEVNTEKWSGPARVTGIDGSKVRVNYAGYERTVHKARVQPFNSEKSIIDDNNKDTDEKNNDDEIDAEKNDEDTDKSKEVDLEKNFDIDDDKEIHEKKNDDDINDDKEKDEKVNDDDNENKEVDTNNKDIRPKRNQIIEYIVNGEYKKGRVIQVGKSGGKNKNRCWIKNDNKEENYDFIKDVSKWKVIDKTVKFDTDKNDSDEKAKMTKDNDHLGIFFLKNKFDIDEELFEKNDDINDATDVFVTLIPSNRHNEPAVIKAKQEELEKWTKYDAFEEIQDNDQDAITYRWVITEKPDGHIKARLCVRGFEEEIKPQSDSPTASSDAMRLFLASSANEGYQIKTLDVTSAFLQGTALERDVYMIPPKEMQKKGIIWKLKKSAYGLYDASRKWYLAVKAELLEMGMRTISGDEALFHMIKNGKLIGMCILHVDDFLVGGTNAFLNELSTKLRGRFTFGKTESGSFKYTGLNIEQKDDGIYVDQIEYIESIKPIDIKRVGDKDSKLNKEEFKKYRALTGQLSWAAGNTRPDLAFDVRELATRNKHATLDDLRNANKILKKAKLEQVKVKYGKLGDWEKLNIVAYTDSSYRNAESGTKSVGGRVIFLMNENGDCCPLGWKSKTIQQVCKSVKTAETRSLEQGAEDAIFLSQMFYELYTGKSKGRIPVKMNIDSKTLHDSLLSTKQVEEKTIRHLVAWIKQQVTEGIIKNVGWVSTDEMLADVFTKKNVKTDIILDVFSKGISKN